MACAAAFRRARRREKQGEAPLRLPCRPCATRARGAPPHRAPASVAARSCWYDHCSVEAIMRFDSLAFPVLLLLSSSACGGRAVDTAPTEAGAPAPAPADGGGVCCLRLPRIPAPRAAAPPGAGPPAQASAPATRLRATATSPWRPTPMGAPTSTPPARTRRAPSAAVARWGAARAPPRHAPSTPAPGHAPPASAALPRARPARRPVAEPATTTAARASSAKRVRARAAPAWAATAAAHGSASASSTPASDRRRALQEPGRPRSSSERPGRWSREQSTRRRCSRGCPLRSRWTGLVPGRSVNPQ